MKGVGHKICCFDLKGERNVFYVLFHVFIRLFILERKSKIVFIKSYKTSNSFFSTEKQYDDQQRKKITVK